MQEMIKQLGQQVDVSQSTASNVLLRSLQFWWDLFVSELPAAAHRDYLTFVVLYTLLLTVLLFYLILIYYLLRRRRPCSSSFAKKTSNSRVFVFENDE